MQEDNNSRVCCCCWEAYQNRTVRRGLEVGQSAGQQGTVAALRVVLQSHTVGLRVLHDQTRVLMQRYTGVQFTCAGIHGHGSHNEARGDAR